MKKVGLLMGSKSDLSRVRPALDLLEEAGVPTEAHILSAHRTPQQVATFAAQAREKGFGVLIAAAGKAAHLAGALAAWTSLPVIGIPIGSPDLSGLDALLATVQMPRGVPVATVAVDGAYNAALLALQILALNDENLAAALTAMKEKMAQEVLAADDSLAEGRKE